jgi:DNA-nicking Smr family endonuclease
MPNETRDGYATVTVPQRGGGSRRINVAELDLHGRTREAAIREVTQVLDTHGEASWVHIITGSGAHSPSGPVLRHAVEAVLKGRKMEYRRTSPGSFLVNAASGVPVVTPTGAAVEAVPSPPLEDPPWAGRPAAAGRFALDTGEADGEHGQAPAACAEAAASAMLDDPIIRRFEEELRQLELARENSLEEAQHQSYEQSKAKEQLRKALRLSQLEDAKRRTEEKLRLEEEMMLALELSRAEAHAPRHREDEEQIQQLLELSEEETPGPSAEGQLSDTEEAAASAMLDDLKNKAVLRITTAHRVGPRELHERDAAPERREGRVRS